MSGEFHEGESDPASSPRTSGPGASFTGGAAVRTREGWLPKSRWSMVFESEEHENDFWDFLVPSFPTANTVTAIATLLIVLYLFFLQTSDQGSSGTDLIIALLITGIFVVGALGHVVMQLLCSYGAMGVRRAHNWSVASIAVFIVIVTCSANMSLYTNEREGECFLTSIYDNTHKAHAASNCYNYLQGYVAVFFTLAVLLHFPLRALLRTSVVTVVLTALISIAYWDTVTVSHFQILNTVVVVSFTFFIRYHRERLEREHYELHIRLEEDVASLKERRHELESVCFTLLPPLVMQRLDKVAADRVDSNANTAVLCVSVHDFARHCTQDTPMAVARVVDSLRARLWTLMESHDLQCVSCVQDRFVAVGNLMKPMKPSTAVYRCCAIGLEVTSKYGFWIEADTAAPSLRAAVHVGPVAGGFVGRRWVHYDCVGEGISVCRAALLVADADTVVATESAVHECHDHLTTHEVGVISGGGGAESSSDIRYVSTSAVYVVTSVDAPNSDNSEGAGLVLAGSSTSLSGARNDGSGSSTSHSLDRDANNSSLHRMSTVAEGLQALHMAQMLLRGNNSAVAILLEFDEHGGVSGESAGGAFTIEQQWGMFDKFAVEETEVEFLDHRAVTNAPHAARTLMAFAWLVLFLFVMLVVYFDGPRAPLGAVMLIIGALGCAASAVFPWSASKKTLLKYHDVWSFVAMLLPLWVIFACTASRPSLVGNDINALIMVATFVRSTCFRDTKYQIIAKPVLLALSQLHSLLPEARIRASAVLVYFLVLWSVVIDRDIDRAERRRFVVELQLRRVLDALTEERRVREGLLRSTMPKVIYEAVIDRSAMMADTVFRGAPDTAVLLVTAGAGHSPTPGGPNATDRAIHEVRTASQQLIELERTLEAFPLMTLINTFADTAIVVSPVVPPRQGRSARSSAHLEQAIRIALALGKSGERGALLEFDETLQVTRLRGGAPSFSVFGPGITRMISVMSAVDHSVLRGAVVTDRVIRIAESIGFHEFDGSPLGPMMIRGVGMLRLTRLISK